MDGQFPKTKIFEKCLNCGDTEGIITKVMAQENPDFVKSQIAVGTHIDTYTLNGDKGIFIKLLKLTYDRCASCGIERLMRADTITVPNTNMGVSQPPGGRPGFKV